MVAVLIVALFLLSCISFAYAGDSSEDMSYDVVQTGGYSGSGYDVVQTDDYSSSDYDVVESVDSSGYDVIQTGGYSGSSYFMEDVFFYMGLIKTIVNSEDYDFSLNVKSCETATPKKGVISTSDSRWKIKLSADLILCEKNFNIIISNLKKAPYLGKNFWKSVKGKQDSFKKNINNAKKHLSDNNLLLASVYIAHAQKDLQNIVGSAFSSKLKYDQGVPIFWKKLNKVEKEYKKIYNRKIKKKNLGVREKKLIELCYKDIKRAKKYMSKGDLERASVYLKWAESMLNELKV